MSSLAGSLAGLFVAGMVGGYAGLCLLAPTDETQTATIAAARVGEPPALPCSMQAWPNADRKCLDWTTPRADSAAKTDGAQKPATAVASTVGMNTSGAGRQSLVPAPQAAPATNGEIAAAPEPQAAPEVAKKAPVAKARAATHTKSKSFAGVPSNAYAFDGSARRSRERSFFDSRSHGLWW